MSKQYTTNVSDLEVNGMYDPTTSYFGGDYGTDWYKRFTFINPLNGEYLYTDIGAGWDVYGLDNYDYNNWFQTLNVSDVSMTVGFMLANGWTGSKEDKAALKTYLVNSGRPDPTDAEYGYIIKDAETFLNKNNINLADLNAYYDKGGVYSKSVDELAFVHDSIEYPSALVVPGSKYYEENIKNKEHKANSNVTDIREDTYNEYWNDITNIEDPNTLGHQMYNRYTTAEQNAAISNMQLAEAQYQQAAMQQAEITKSIVDQVKSERMAKLRAGMSESQIANQDMQIMLNNMNTLNQNMNTLNQNQLAAQQQYNLAQDTAYQQYINSAQGLGTSAAAMYASAIADPILKAKQYAQGINKDFTAGHYKNISQGS